MKKQGYLFGAPSWLNGGRPLLYKVEGTVYMLGDYELLVYHHTYKGGKWKAYYKGDVLNFHQVTTWWWHDKWKYDCYTARRTRKELYAYMEKDKEDLITLIKEKEANGDYEQYEKALIDPNTEIIDWTKKKENEK